MKKVAFTFGRMNCPTIGHGVLLDALKKTNPSEYRVYLSKTQDAKKNPLTYDQKMKYAKEMFPQHSKAFREYDGKTVFDVLSLLHKEKVSDVVMVVGDDRVPEFEDLVPKYNGVEGRHGFYKFDSIQIVSAGHRDPDSDGADGMSASKMRAAAQSNDRTAFNKGLPKGYNGDSLWKDIRKGMKLEESKMLTYKEFLTEAYSQDTKNIIKALDKMIDHFGEISNKDDLAEDLDNIKMAVEDDNNSDEDEVVRVVIATLKAHKVNATGRTLADIIKKLGV